MTDKESSLRSPAAIKLASLKDLVKLVVSSVGPDRIAGYIGYHAEKDRSIYFIFNTSLGYYDLNALPIIIWVEESVEPQGSFIRYRTSPKEELEYSNNASDPKWLNIPIVNFETIPEFLKIWR